MRDLLVAFLALTLTVVAVVTLLTLPATAVAALLVLTALAWADHDTTKMEDNQ